MALGHVGRGYLRDRLVEIGVEFLALRCDRLDAVLLEDAHQLLAGQLDAGKDAFDRIARVLARLRVEMIDRMVEGVGDGEEILRKTRQAVLDRILRFALAAPAHVFRFRHGAQELVLEVGEFRREPLLFEIDDIVGLRRLALAGRAGVRRVLILRFVSH